MSQSAGRRSTLASIDPNQNHGQGLSSIPVPSSAIKSAKTLSSSSLQPRPSMLPQQQYQPRQSILPYQSSSTLQQQQLQQHPQSQQLSQQSQLLHPQLNTPHHIAQSGKRGDGGMYASRQSMASAGRQSIAAPTPNHRRSIGGRLSIAPGNMANTASSLVRETRPIKEKQYKYRMGMLVKEHLERTGFTMAGWDANKGVHEPTQSAFVGMFKHIYATCIDKNFVMGADGKKFEDEVLTLMKEIKYPAADELSKTKLTAAGSQSHWPYCLAMLEWMVNLGNQIESIGSGPRSRVDDVQDLQSLFFPYLWNCYDRFWQNEDTYPEEYEKLGQRFDEKNAVIEQDLRELQQEHHHLSLQLAEYKDKEPPLKIEQKENEMLNRDVDKFKIYYDEVLVPKLEKIRKATERLAREIQLIEREIEEKARRKQELQEQVDAQEISAEEYEKMLAERDRLTSRLETLGRLNKEAASDGWSLEIAIAKKQADTEDRISKFNPLARSISLLPFSLSLGEILEELELTPTNPSTMLQPGVDLIGNLMPQVHVLRENETERYRQASKKRLEMEGEYEQFQDVLSEQESQLQSGRERCENLKKEAAEYDKNNKKVQEEHTAAESMLEKTTFETETAGSLQLQQAESRLTSLQLTAEQKEDEWNRQRIKMDEDMLNFVVLLSKMKGDVSSQLREIQATVTLKSRDD